MANNADGTDGTGRTATSRGSVVSGKSAGYGATASKGISDASKTVSGKSDSSFGTRTGKSSSRFPGGSPSTSTINKNGG